MKSEDQNQKLQKKTNNVNKTICIQVKVNTLIDKSLIASSIWTLTRKLTLTEPDGDSQFKKGKTKSQSNWIHIMIQFHVTFKRTFPYSPIPSRSFLVI
jgi:hypothetical protein